MSNVPKKLLSRASDVAFRLGCDAQVQAMHQGHETRYALAFHDLTLEQVKNLLHWLDYYVPTLDEQNLRQYGPTHDEAPRKAGAS